MLVKAGKVDITDIAPPEFIYESWAELVKQVIMFPGFEYFLDIEEILKVFVSSELA